MSDTPKRTTCRGFRVYAEIIDDDGNTIKVIQSSADPLDRVRIYSTNARGAEVLYFPANNTGWHDQPSPRAGGPGYAAVGPHLSPEQCRELIRALEAHLTETAE